MARHTYPTRHAAGPFRLVRHRLTGGYAIMDTRTRTYAYAEPHPVTGRPMPAHLPLNLAMDRAQRLAREERAR